MEIKKGKRKDNILLNVSEVSKRIVDEVSTIVVGKKREIEMLLVALLCEGHVLLEGVPGIGKTLLAKTFAQAIGGSYKRIQMTPDLLPADITGSQVYNPKNGEFSLRKGPIFANVILADELNRASPKTQAAMLEVMQERQVTIEGESLAVDRPFTVFGTQIPYGAAGTYPLIEVQIDRFAFKIGVGYPSFEEEVEIVSRIDSIEQSNVVNVTNPQEMVNVIKRVREVHVSDRVKQYLVNLIGNLRENEDVSSGPSTRASIWLFKGCRAKAILDGRDYVIPDDVKFVAPYVLEHRVIRKPELEVAGTSVGEMVNKVLTDTPVPKE